MDTHGPAHALSLESAQVMGWTRGKGHRRSSERLPAPRGPAAHRYWEPGFSRPLHISRAWPQSSVPTGTAQAPGVAQGPGWKGLGSRVAR